MKALEAVECINRAQPIDMAGVLSYVRKAGGEAAVTRLRQADLTKCLPCAGLHPQFDACRYAVLNAFAGMLPFS